MRRRLPSLSSLIAAEAVGRHASFTAASSELLVTPSAVSHQVRDLEAWLGFSLFERSTRAVVMTSAGRSYLTAVSQTLNALEVATTKAVDKQGNRRTFRLQTTDSFASRWLVDRLPDFVFRNPMWPVQISTWEYTEGFRSDEADVAVLYGRGDWPRSLSTLLLKETILPVCSPALIKKNNGAVLLSPLLHDDNLGVTWPEWAAIAKVELTKYLKTDFNGGLHFNHSHLALQSAEKGSGIVLASRPLIQDALEKGKLVAPFEHQIATGFGYYVVQPRERRQRERCRPLVEWLLAMRDHT
jgi:LysR family glycine cleavage system transcriptional activator